VNELKPGPQDDHLDYYTIMDLWQHHEATIHFFLPIGQLNLICRTSTELTVSFD